MDNPQVYLNTVQSCINFLIKHRKKIPLEVFHEVNFSCNLVCKYCGLPNVKIKEMSTEQIKRAIKEFTDAGTITWCFTGGEPLLRKDIGKLINYAKDCGIMFVNLTTNGIFFKKKLNELKKIDRIYFSLDGPKEINDRIRGINTYEKIIDSIKLAKRENFDIFIQTIICEENVKDDFFGLKFLFRLAEEMDVRILFHPLYTHKYNKNFISKYMLTKQKNIEALNLIKKNKKQNKFIGRSNVVYDEWIKMFEGKKTRLKNYAGLLYCFLFPDGKVNSCRFRENGSADGLKEGFVNAFNKLSSCNDCNCISFLVDRNLLYSLNFNVLKELLF